jgi:predicted nucleic acid-binding protein
VIVVTDTSVVLNLCCIGQERLLPELFGQVIAPATVASEFQKLATEDSRFSGLPFPDFIQVVESVQCIPALTGNRRLHAGEISALSLAVQQQIGVVLMDDSAGRATAVNLGIRCVGILGILIQAKGIGLLASISPLLDELESKAGFWISPALRQRVLGLAHE